MADILKVQFDSRKLSTSEVKSIIKSIVRQRTLPHHKKPRTQQDSAQADGTMRDRPRSELDEEMADIITSIDAWIQAFLLSETQDDEILNTAVRVVRIRFLKEATRHAVLTFPVPTQRQGLIASAKRRAQSIMCHYSVFQKMPRVWVYHRVHEALRDIRIEILAPSPEKSAESIAALPADLFDRPIKCTLDGPAGAAVMAPAGSCTHVCRFRFLKWMGFSGDEIATALGRSRSWVQRWFKTDECTGPT